MVSFQDLSLEERRTLVGQGTEHFRTHATDLSEAELNAPSLLAGWKRRQLIAHLGYNAAGMCRLLDGAAAGVAKDMYASAKQREDDIAESVDLDVTALYRLFNTETQRLETAWKELPTEAWSVMVKTPQGKPFPASETLWMRSREVWIHAVDLDTGATFELIPPVVQQTLFDEVIAGWRGSGMAVAVDVESTPAITVSIDDKTSDVRDIFVQGTMPALLSWMTGRGNAGVSPADAAPAPAWL
jgi:maleylpyruvate isomerase